MSEQDQIELKPKPQAENAPAPGPMPEDAGSQALAEALRSSFVIVKIVMVLLAIAFFASGIFIVRSQEKAMILRFGKPLGEGEKALLDAGFHWAFPRPIDEIVRIPISTQQQANSTVAWYLTTPELEAAKAEPPPEATLKPADGYTLTSDANIIHTRATLRYHVTDPIRFHFGYVNAREFVTNALNNALLFASAHFTVDDALAGKASAFKEKVVSRVNELIAQQQLGVAVDQLDVVAIPPRQLEAKFNEVGQTRIKRNEVRDKAESYATEVLSKARAQAEGRVNAAVAERAQLVGMVEAEAKKFTELLPQYEANPELFVNLRQIETLEKVMGNAQEKIFVPSRADGKTRELRLQLSREPQKPKSASTTQP